MVVGSGGRLGEGGQRTSGTDGGKKIGSVFDERRKKTADRCISGAVYTITVGGDVLGIGLTTGGRKGGHRTLE